MGSVLHANAKTTRRIREEIQASSSVFIEPLKLIQRLSIKPQNHCKVAKNETTEDKKSGPKARRSVLSDLEQAAIGGVRRQTHLSLDDLLMALKPNIPTLTRSI